MYEFILAMILAIAAEYGVPPYFALAIALEENCCLNPNAVNINSNGTVDRGIMQLNSSWFIDENWDDPETNIRAGVEHIKWLMGMPELHTYWSVAVAYNCGYAGFLGGAPLSSLEYADRVMARWLDLANLSYVNPVIPRRGYR